MTYKTDRELLSLVLRPYRQGCQYLKTAVLELAQDRMPTVSGDFEIGDSCYIDDTGHFNAVEFNICYNQLAYYLIAKSVQEALLPAMRHWTLEDFWRLQLPDILITDFRSTFKRKMRGKTFSGSVSLTDITRVGKSDWCDALIVLHTSCRFWDEPGGLSHGKVTLAITNPI
ncbi:MAG TPA: FcoT family thioesterase [Streptosporangiaceae bacterium]|nr:FcoT family thioesterase [Streptosporangiaceae bacterium]